MLECRRQNSMLRWTSIGSERGNALYTDLHHGLDSNLGSTEDEYLWRFTKIVIVLNLGFSTVKC